MKSFLTFCLMASLAVVASAQSTTFVTFAVDMNDVDTFDREQDVLRVAGNFQDPQWTPQAADSSNVLTDPDSNGVFAVTIEVDTAAFEYKYVINNWNGTGERTSNELFPDEDGDCVSGDGDGNANRIASVDLAEDSLALPVYVYDACDISSRSVASSTRNLPALAGVSVAPNPMTDFAVVSLPDLAGETYLVRVFGADGRVIGSPRTTTSASLRLNREGLARGLYVVDVTATRAGRRAVLRMLVD